MAQMASWLKLIQRLPSLVCGSPGDGGIYTQNLYAGLGSAPFRTRDGGLWTRVFVCISQNVFINQFQKFNSPTKSSTYYLPLPIETLSLRFCEAIDSLKPIDKNIMSDESALVCMTSRGIPVQTGVHAYRLFWHHSRRSYHARNLCAVHCVGDNPGNRLSNTIIDVCIRGFLVHKSPPPP